MRKTQDFYWKWRNINKNITFFSSFNPAKTPFNSVNFDCESVASRKLKALRNESFKKKFIRQIQEMNYLITQENRFQNQINYANFTNKINQNLTSFIENSNDLGFFLKMPQFVNFLEILKKINFSLENNKNLNGFLSFFLDYFSFFLETQMRTSNEVFPFIEYYLFLFENSRNSNKNVEKTLEIFIKMKKLFEKSDFDKKFSLFQMKIFLNFVKNTPQNTNTMRILDDFFQKIFKQENVDINPLNFSEYLLWKLEFFPFLCNSNFEKSDFKHQLINSLKTNIDKIPDSLHEILRTILNIKTTENSSDFIADILCSLIAEIEKSNNFFEKLSIKEIFEMISVLKQKFLRDKSFKKRFISIFLDSCKENTLIFSLEPKEIDLWGSKWLYVSNRNESIEEEISRLLVLNFHKMGLKLLMVSAFLNNSQLIDLIKYEVYLYSCIQNRLLEEKQVIFVEDFIEIFQILIKDVPEKKIPVFLEIFSEIIEDLMDNIPNNGKFIEFIHKLIPKSGLAFYDNYKFLSKIDNVVMNKFFNAKNLNENCDLYESFTSINSLKLFDFYREFSSSLKEQFKTMDFLCRIKYLFIVSKIYSVGDYNELLELFQADMIPVKINSLSNIQDCYKLLNLLIYDDIIQKIDQNSLKYLFNCFYEILKKTENKALNATLKQIYKKINNIKHVFQLLHPEIYNEIPSKLKDLLNNLKKEHRKEYEEKHYHRNRFQSDFVLKIKCIYPNIKLKENFFLFENEFECDVWIEDWKILIELCGPTHFLPNESFELDPIFWQILKLKERILKPMKTIVVPYYEWNNLSDGLSNEKINFIKKILEIKI